MARRWAANASPVILLARVGHADLLFELSDELAIPDAVRREIDAGPANDPARAWLLSRGTEALGGPEPVDPVVAAWDLGRGESAVLSWARQRPGAEAIVDDLAARNCAASLGVAVRGTLGVVLLARQEGRLAEAGPVFDELLAAGMRIDERVLAAALRLAGESERLP